MGRPEGLWVDHVVGLTRLKRPLDLDRDHSRNERWRQLYDGLVERGGDRGYRVIGLDVISVVQADGPDVVAALREVLVVVKGRQRHVLGRFDRETDLFGGRGCPAGETVFDEFRAGHDLGRCDCRQRVKQSEHQITSPGEP